MIGHMSLRIGLGLLIASGVSAAAQKYPNTADDDLPRNTIGGEYRVMERTPVYRSRVSGERAFFYLPKNSRVEILGKFEGWGVFSVYTPERFKTLLTEAAPDEKTQYGWVHLEQLRRTDNPKRPCPDVPPASPLMTILIAPANTIPSARPALSYSLGDTDMSGIPIAASASLA